MKVFGDFYTRCYDLLYRDKDYRAEARYVVEVLREQAKGSNALLELGCGTGRYTEHFVQAGYAVHGVDLSPDMLARAKERCPTTAFSSGDMSHLELGITFDAAVALFHVVNYLPTNRQLDGFFRSMSAHLIPGGVLAFDFWYGPAVLSDRPTVRVKRTGDEDLEVLRITEPRLLSEENVVEVNFETHIHVRKSGERFQERELHRMRYLFMPEIDGWLEAHGFERLAAHRFGTREDLGPSSWYGMVVARKRTAA
jgi:SAM-dependent methyltransferase